MNTQVDKNEVAKVHVLIVNYKSADLTLKCVDSLQSERDNPLLDLEVVVIENCSGDAEALRQGLESRPGVHLMEAEKNGGFAYGNNLGFQRAFQSESIPDYFFLLNPDTEVRPGAIRTLCDFLQAHPSAGMAGSSLENADGSEWPIAFRFPSLLGEVEQGLRFGPVSKLLERWQVAKTMGKQQEEVDWLPGAAILVKRELIEKIGGLDEQYFLYYEETDFCLKAKRAGYGCWYVPESRVMHIAGQSTGVTTKEGDEARHPGYWYESRRRFFAKNYGLPYAAASDIAYATSASLGWVKSLVQRRPDAALWHLYDVLRHSPLAKAKNRALDPEKTFRPER